MDLDHILILFAYFNIILLSMPVSHRIFRLKLFINVSFPMRAEWPAYLMHRDLIVPTIECLVNSQTVKLLSVHRSPFS